MDMAISEQRQGEVAGGITAPRVLLIISVWMLVIVAASLWMAVTIFQAEEAFFGLGSPVKVFIGHVALLPAILAGVSIPLMRRRHPAGRYIAMVINYVTMVLGGFVLLSLWGVFLGMDNLSPAILAHYPWLIGLPVAWVLWWGSGKLPEDGPVRLWLERAAVALGALTLIVFLLSAGILDAASAILGTYGRIETWITTGVMLISGVLAWRLMRLGVHFHEKPEGQEAWQGWLMLSPNIIGFMLFFAGPLLLSFYLSFTNDTVGQVPDVIGLENYATILSLEIATTEDMTVNTQSVMSSGFTALGEIVIGSTRYVLGARDPMFWYSLRNTLIFCLVLVPLAIIPALLLAMIMNTKLAGMKFFRAVYFVPSVAAVVGTALIWRWLYDPTIGFINYVITGIVTFLNNTFGMSIVDPNINWLTDPGVQLFAIVLLAAWQVIGFNTVLFLAGLQGIPKILYEAAYVDGANGWQRFRNVTLPLLAPTTFFVMITTIITGLQVFNEPYALISVRPMPVNATTVVYNLYNRGFFFFDFGYASAIAWLLFGLIFLVTLAQFRLQRSQAYDS